MFFPAINQNKKDYCKTRNVIYPKIAWQGKFILCTCNYCMVFVFISPSSKTHKRSGYKGGFPFGLKSRACDRLLGLFSTWWYFPCGEEFFFVFFQLVLSESLQDKFRSACKIRLVENRLNDIAFL